jgi:CheY-like chemotaxis protein
MDGLRILVASPLGLIIQPALEARFPAGTVTVAQSPEQVERAVRGRLRHDVVISDLMWNSEAEYSFDGLDVLEVLRAADRPAPVVMATQGHGLEADHLEEVLARPEVRGVYRKSEAPPVLFDVLTEVAGGGTVRPAPGPASVPTIHGWFDHGRGRTAARMAGAIASGRATSHATLAAAANVRYDTAAKIGREYLGELIWRRGEHPEPAVPAPVVYRWCGEHVRYILSWCRRNGHADVARRVVGPA